MTRPHGTDAMGRSVDLIGQLIGVRQAPSVGIRIVKREDITMPKAEKDGVYTLGNGRFFVKQGDPLPEGAEMVGDPTDEQRAKGAAPENKSKQAAPENRAKKSDG